MSDLISRADALEAIKLLHAQLDEESVQRCIEAASNLPSAQIIRCKDCKFSVDEYGDNECYCRNRLNGTYLMYIKDWDHYCSWAERKEE